MTLREMLTQSTGGGEISSTKRQGEETSLAGGGEVTALAGEGEVTRTPKLNSDRSGFHIPKLYTARAELVLAQGPLACLRVMPLKPDPLEPLAEAMAEIDEELGDRAEICVDLLPMTPHQTRGLTRSLEHRNDPTTGGGLRGWKDAFAQSNGARPAVTAHRSSGRRAVTESKFATGEGVFDLQLLIRVQSEIPQRPSQLLRRIIAAFDGWSSEHNRWKVRGRNVLGVAFLGADSLLYRAKFDKRFQSGQLDTGSSRSVVTTSEIAGLLKPPTKHCRAQRINRSGGLVPPAPLDLPTFQLGKPMIPLGHVMTRDGGERMVGQWLNDLKFSLALGATGTGKTEPALARQHAIASAGIGTFFLDPHGDGWEKMRPYQCGPGMRDRIWEVMLDQRDESRSLAGWNLLGMRGQNREHIEDRVDQVVSGFAAVLGWGTQAPRAKTILTKAAQTLCELSYQLPPNIQPTIFQIPTLLENEDWRNRVIAALPEGQREFWLSAFDRYPAEATSPVTNLIHRIRSSSTIAAFLGSPETTFDLRRAMDNDKIVWVTTPGTGESNSLVSAFLIFELFRAGRSRGDIPPEERRPFHAFIDELTAIDGAAKGNIPAILEQLRKFRMYLHAMTQMADRLSPDTRRAFFQNRSLLSAARCAFPEARMVCQEWGGEVEPSTITKLPDYTHVISMLNAGQETTPFKIRGPLVSALYEGLAQPEYLDELPAVIDQNMGRRPVRETLARMGHLDADIADHLDQRIGNRPPPEREAASPKLKRRAHGSAGSDVTPAPAPRPTPAAGPPAWDEDPETLATVHQLAPRKDKS